MSKGNKKNQVDEEIKASMGGWDDGSSESDSKEAKSVTQQEMADKRIAELEKQLADAESRSGSKSDKERIAALESKLSREKNQEELYHERKEKYLQNVKKRKDKEAAKAAALKEIEERD